MQETMQNTKSKPNSPLMLPFRDRALGHLKSIARACTLAASMAFTCAPVQQTPSPQIQTFSNLIWSGYEVDAPRYGSIIGISSYFTVPKLGQGCDLPGRIELDPQVAIWIGIGGDGGEESLIQIGLLGSYDYVGKTHSASMIPFANVAYTAVYEMLPNRIATIHMDIRPGDTLYASITKIGNGGKFLMHLEDLSRPQRPFSKIVRYDKDTYLLTPHNSAEWIVEKPTLYDTTYLFPLAGFGSVTFTHANITYKNVLGADPQIQESGIGGPRTFELNMYTDSDLRGDYMLAKPSALFANGTQFTVVDQNCAKIDP